MIPGAPAIDRAEHLRSECAKIAAAATFRMNVMVPTCPKWNVEQLVAHLTEHHRWVAASIEAADPSTPTPHLPEPDLSGEQLLALLSSGADHLAHLLGSVSDDRPAWSWAGDNRKGFWARRTSIETMIHRWDIENAMDAPQPLPQWLAADGVDEMTMVILPLQGGHDPVIDGSLHLTAIDTENHWLIRVGPTGAVSKRDSGPADLHLAGTAEALLLVLWGRIPAERLEVTSSGPAADDLLRWLAE